jgi:hypothetical protein
MGSAVRMGRRNGSRAAQILTESPGGQRPTTETADAACNAENRPLSNLIETAALSRIREQQFVDNAEMSGILANENLLKRLKKIDEKRRTVCMLAASHRSSAY